MGGGGIADPACAWVTQALGEEDIEKALVLGKSLRRVLTRKSLVVIVRATISLALRDILESTFDFVLSLDEQRCRDLLEVNMGRDALAKAFTMSFTFFERCIYLPTSSLVLKNCDELFDDDKKMTPLSGTPSNGSSAALKLSTSRESFRKLTEYFSSLKNQRGKVEPDAMLIKWIQNQLPDHYSFLEEPYLISIPLEGRGLRKNDDNLIIAHLIDLPVNLVSLDFEKKGFYNSGLLEKFVYGSWLEIYKNEVKVPTPVINSNGIPTSSPSCSRINSFREPIAVVGMSCRYPSSNNITEFWNLLFDGRDGIRTPPDYRWTKEQSIYQKPETRNTQAGFLNVPVDEFDAKFFGISPKEMIFIDPQHRILHELVWEALEDAGINPLALNGTNGGVFMGSWRNDYYDILSRSSSMEFYRGYMGNSFGTGAARISHLLGLTGPCIATESGCSAAMVAVHMACRSLQNGESDMALACGVNMLLHPFTTDIMPMVTAPDGHCKSFDAQADGFGRAEGAGVLVLKRLSEAVRDGDGIWGVIKGTSIAQEGISKSMGTPTVHCEAQAMRSALKEANIHPSQVSYVESHGTGTIVGDPMEVAAIGRVYSEGREEPLVIGSVKTNVGHTESCSGITGIMKVILSMKNEWIPQHRNFKEINPDVNLEIIPAKLPLEPIKWPKIQGKPRTAGVSSFGITGTDGHVVIQEPLEYAKQRIVLPGFERPLHLMTISARTEEALDILLERYKDALSREGLPDKCFPNIAYTSNVGKAKFNWRAAVIAKDPTEAIAELQSNKLLSGEIASEDMSGKVCFLFTGQGSQYHGMAKELYDTNPIFQMNFDYCEDILQKNHKISIAKTFWGKEDNEEVSRTLYSQTGIFVVEFCLMKLWESWGVKPDYVLGHSLGEFCAAVCAGILTFEEALTLVAERSRLIDALPQGKMLVIKADKSSVDTLLKRYTTEKKDSKFWLDYAAVNSSDQTVLAGDANKVVAFSEWLKGKDIKSAILQSSHAFHSRHMDPMIKEYRSIAAKIFKNKKVTELTCNYVSGMLGKILDLTNEPINWPDYWVQHTREKVSFLNASKAVYVEGGCRLFLEVGPHPVLTAFTMINNEGKPILCLPSLRRNETDWKTIMTTIAKLFVSGALEIDWKRFDQFYERRKVGQLLPTYPFQGTKYWPNITSSSGVQIHPLLGSNIPNPTNSKLYQNNLSLQNVEYLKDHVIGSLVVFPGAGYMETLLMAGYATLDGANTEFRLPRKPIQLENFRIEAPLGLEEGVGCLCQTVVEANTSSGDGDSTGGALNVRIYHEMKETEENFSKWVSHASASVSPYNPGSGLTEQVEMEDQQYYLEAMNRLKTTGKEEATTKEFYDKVAEVGLMFGPTFRTLSRVWRLTETKHEFLAEVSIPRDSGCYLVHPTIIDAMIQASVFHGEKSKKIEKKLQVPIGCERFVWFRPLTPEGTSMEGVETEGETGGGGLGNCYIYSGGNSRTIVLLNSDGHVVAALVKVEAIETNAKSIRALLETQVKSVPDCYKTNWKSTLGPFQNRLDFSMGPDVHDTLLEEISDQSDYSEGAMESRRDLITMCAHYIQAAFLNCGWKPKIGDKFNHGELVTELGIKSYHKQLIRQYLIFLEQDGILEGYEDDNTERYWTVKVLPEPAEVLMNTCEELVQKHDTMGKDAMEFLLLRNMGVKLDKILTGTESALRILFPDDESQPSVAKFYDCIFRKTKHMIYDQWVKTWKNYKAAYESKGLPLPLIRILEVGAGTGSVTEATLKSLEDGGVPYEYHYTDISAAFFPTAEKRFEKHRKFLKFRKLNLEQDPTSQGFPPNYFDFIVAAQVIHATRDLKETFLNLRMVLRDNGNLVLNETLGAKRLFDCIFGVLDGFWRFTDFELRPHHAMLTIDQWDDLGKQTGYGMCEYCNDYELALIAYRADPTPPDYAKTINAMNPGMQKILIDSQVAWVIFYGDEEEDYVFKLKQRYEEIGRKVLILVKSGKSCEVTPKSDSLHQQFTIRPELKEDMDKLFETLSQLSTRPSPLGFVSIEGILVTYGLFSNERDQSVVAQPFLYMIQNVLLLDKKTTPQVVILSAGQYAVGDVLCENPSPSTLLGMSRCIANEHHEMKIRGIDMNPSEIQTNVEEIFQEIFTGFNDEVAYFCAFRGRERYIPKIYPEKIAVRGGSLPLPPSTDRFQLIHPKSKSIQDLEFGDLDLFTLKPNEIEVKVKCSALNFKDILNILKPIEEFKDSDGVGFDFAGVVTAIGEGVTQRKIGDAVFGINIMGNALPSHIKLPEDAVAVVPASCTLTEAACFPAVFSTAFYCLKNVANCKKGETLLIHTASGGVGVITIQLARYFGLNIICTAGNERKRAYLRSLGVKHVFHSRNTNYGKQIMEVTNGKGIDIVLNSLTGPGFKEATLGACASGARFVEMSKLNIWSEEEVARQRPDIKYTIVDLTKLDEATSRKLLLDSGNLIETGVVTPIPFTRFDAQNIREALTYLQKAQHIGKVVVTMPEPIPAQIELTNLYTPLFNDRSTYVITGGLGGIGMEVCKYMIFQGARNMVLIGRKPPSEKTLEVINSYKSEYKGCNIVTFQADVGEFDQCERVFKKIKDPALNLPPVRGVMHAAGTIADAMIENQKWEDFQKTFQSKVRGTWNMHDITRDCILEHFVLFSSVTAPFGSPGQASHVAACTFEDTMAHYRISHGLPATTINWGQFGQIGIAAEADVATIRPFSPQQGINALDMIIRQNKNYLVVASFEKALTAILKFLPYTKRVIDEQVLKIADSTHTSKKTLQLSSAQFWEEYNECKDEREEKVDVIRRYTKILLRHVLRLEGDEPIDENMDLQDLGVDSLMMLELKNHLQEIMGDRIQVTQSAMKDCNTVNLLADRLVQVIEEEGEFSTVEPPTMEEIHVMVIEDSKLPENVRAQIPGSEKKPSEIKVVLMTGATGVLGSHMLRELLEECPQLEKVICLVRTRGGESAEERLTTVLDRKNIKSFMKNFHKVHCISGNFIEDRLGLSDPDYFALTNEVDAVLHVGAKVSHVEYYRNVSGGRSDARSVNVGGLVKILEFAGMSKTKHVLNASTLLCVENVNEDGTILEGWPWELAVPFNRGYLVSKHVCDLLLKQANDRGIPCKSFKYAELRGSKVTGGSLLETSHIMKSFLFFMREGIMPDTPIPANFLPIDVASRITVRIMVHDDAPNDVYNVTHPEPQLAQEYFPKLAKELGHPVEMVTWEEYRQKAQELSIKEEKNRDKATLLAEFQDLYRDDESGFTGFLSGGVKSIQKFLENPDGFFKSKHLAKYVPDLYGQIESSYDIHKRDLLAGKNEGLFEKIGL